MTWREFLHAVTGGDGLAEAALQEFAGYCVLADNRFGVLLGVSGPAAETGLVLSALVDLVGIEAVIQIGHCFMDEPAERARLRGRALAFSSDWGGIAASTWFLPALAGEILVGANGNGVMRFVPRCKFVFGAERPAQFESLPWAVRERLVSVELRRLTPPLFLLPLNTRLRAALMGERPAIRAWAVEGLERLLARGAFPPGSVAQR
jgi:hypothetical protein